MRIELATIAVVTMLTANASTYPRGQEKKSSPNTQAQPALEGIVLEVRDQSGAPVRNASVTILSYTSRKELHAATNDAGQLRIADLAGGSYEITIIADGFRNIRTLNIAVPCREVVTLEPGAAPIVNLGVPELPLDSSPISKQLSEPPSTVSISQQSGPSAEQSGFNYEQEIDPVRNPVVLSQDALLTLAKDNLFRSCLDSENLAPESPPARWFVASLIHLSSAQEIDLVVLPSGPLPDTPQGEISKNACLVGPNTGGFWVLGHTPTGFALVLGEMAIAWRCYKRGRMG
jgi:Carboxypeptidase regulatory-like domain